MAQGALRFGMLGPLQASANGADLPLGAAKQRAVLAILLINRNRIVPIDSLIDAAYFFDDPATQVAFGYVATIRIGHQRLLL